MTPDLSYYLEGGRAWRKDNKWDEDKKMLQRFMITTHSIPIFFREYFYFYLSIFYANIICRLFFFGAAVVHPEIRY